VWEGVTSAPKMVAEMVVGARPEKVRGKSAAREAVIGVAAVEADPLQATVMNPTKTPKEEETAEAAAIAPQVAPCRRY